MGAHGLRSLDRLLPKHLGPGHPKGCGWRRQEYLNACFSVAGLISCSDTAPAFPLQSLLSLPQPWRGQSMEGGREQNKKSKRTLLIPLSPGPEARPPVRPELVEG